MVAFFKKSIHESLELQLKDLCILKHDGCTCGAWVRGYATFGHVSATAPKTTRLKYPSLLLLAIMAAGVASSFAQGTVVFNNGTGLVNYWTGPFPPPRGDAAVQLFWAATGTPYTPWSLTLTPSAWYAANPGWSLGPVVKITTPAAGKFNGGTITLSPLAPGGTIDYVIAGWTGAAYSTMDAALAANSMVGVSSKFSSATGNPTITPAGAAVPLADSFGGLTLIPEPSSLAMGLLGAVTLFVLRRLG